MAENIGELFTQKHRKLIQFSRVASIFAWVALAVYVFQAIAQFVGFTNRQDFQSVVNYPGTDIAFLLNLLGIILRGVVYWFTLKGISLGLNMIVETDLNYREKAQG